MSQVNLNGALFFDTPNGAFTPTSVTTNLYSIIAPYWADVDVLRNNGRLYYRDSITGTSESVNKSWQTLLNIIDNGAYFKVILYRSRYINVN